MDTLQILQRLLLALAIGLLIGVERGWQDRAGKEGSRAAGVRTYALIGLLGGLSELLDSLVGFYMLGFIFAAFAGCLVLFEWREAQASDSSSATGTIAGLVTFTLGAYAVGGDQVAAGAAGIATTIVLAERQALHAFVSQLTWKELRAALLLLAMTFVLLPILPDRTVDPWDALNPRQLWLMMVVIAAVSYVGYICVRVMGARAGLVSAAAAGGLVSSTAVTLAYSRLSKQQPAIALPLASGIAAAWSVSLLRMSVIAITLAPSLLEPIGLTLGPPAIMLALFGAGFYWRAGQLKGQPPLVLNDPFELSEVFKFGALLAGVTLIARLANVSHAQLGLVPLAAVSGLVDVDPITLSTARMTGSMLTPEFAATVILIAGGANQLCKSAVAVVLGTRALSLRVLLFSVAAALAGAGSWIVLNRAF
jgi:uncharacterized membrane protein (DUF4010 family)